MLVQGYSVEVVYVGSAGHLRRYKVVDSQGRYVPGGLFRIEAEALTFILLVLPDG